MSMVYQETDGDLDNLNGKQVGIIGYGNLGRPMALNLRDSGVNVLIGENDPQRQAIAMREGFELAATDELVQQVSILMLMVPDERMPQIYLEQVSPNLGRNHTLIFSSSYNIAFGFIEAPSFIDVGLIAPRTMGVAVRQRYLEEQGFFSFVARRPGCQRQCLANSSGPGKSGGFAPTRRRRHRNRL